MTQLDELIASYASVMSEKERASLEAQIWSLIPKPERPPGGLGDYMHARFGAQTTYALCRQQLLRAGPCVEELWIRVAAGMPLNTAISVFRSVKGSEDVADAISKALRTYDTTGYEARSADGKVTRRRKPSRLRKPGDLAPASEVAHDRTFWKSLRSMMSEYVNSRLAGCDPMDVDKLLRRFEVDLNLLITDFQDKISDVPKRGIEILSVSRQALIAACRTLGMDPPRPNKPVDMKLASLQKKRYARVYHPDVHGGSEATRGQFESVMQAYKVLEQYNDFLPVVRKTEKPHDADAGDQNGQ